MRHALLLLHLVCLAAPALAQERVALPLDLGGAGAKVTIVDQGQSAAVAVEVYRPAGSPAASGVINPGVLGPVWRLPAEGSARLNAYQRVELVLSPDPAAEHHPGVTSGVLVVLSDAPVRVDVEAVKPPEPLPWFWPRR